MRSSAALRDSYARKPSQPHSPASATTATSPRMVASRTCDIRGLAGASSRRRVLVGVSSASSLGFVVASSASDSSASSVLGVGLSASAVGLRGRPRSIPRRGQQHRLPCLLLCGATGRSACVYTCPSGPTYVPEPGKSRRPRAHTRNKRTSAILLEQSSRRPSALACSHDDAHAALGQDRRHSAAHSRRGDGGVQHAGILRGDDGRHRRPFGRQHRQHLPPFRREEGAVPRDLRPAVGRRRAPHRRGGSRSHRPGQPAGVRGPRACLPGRDMGRTGARR